MGELLKKAELLSQAPSMGNVFGIIEQLAKAIEALQPKEKVVKTTGVTESSVEENVQPKKRRGRKPKNV